MLYGIDSERILTLTKHAVNVRLTLLQMIYLAQSGHPGGSLSCADILTALYFDVLRIDPDKPDWPERDRFVLSKGHCCPALYACLILRGFIPKTQVNSLRKYGSILQGHPDRKKTLGVDASTGSLGQGAAIGVGMAIALKNSKPLIYVLVGDGETQEGIIWETAQAASKYHLDNYIVLVDANRIQNDGFCDDIMPTNDIGAKFTAFGFEVTRTDGHNMAMILNALDKTRLNRNGKPKCIVFQTVKGKGVPFMENNPVWHGTAPNETQYQEAVNWIQKM